MKKDILRLINKIMSWVGYEVKVTRISRRGDSKKDDKIRINLGSGNWDCNGWICLDYPSEHYKKQQKGHKIIPYDIRSDKIPFEDCSVDEIYCSHVIEHIETKFVKSMLLDCKRVLKPKTGILRICCPDAEYLYNMSKIGKEYWKWMEYWYKQRNMDFESLRPVDCLVAEVATPQLLGFGYLQLFKDYQKEFDELNMEDFFDLMINGLEYNVEHVSDHINWWSYDKLKVVLDDVGFSNVICSKYGGSYCYDMQNRVRFDKTHPEMSLYVDALV